MPIRSQMAGLTLIELMVTLSIVAILAAIAVPSFNSFFISSRAQSETASFVEALSYARSEAVRRGATVTLQAASGTDWHQGWTVVTPGGETLRSHGGFAGATTLSAAAGQVAFNNRGYLDGAAAGSALTFNYCFAAGNDDQERRVVVNHLGHTRASREVCP